MAQHAIILSVRGVWAGLHGKCPRQTLLSSAKVAPGGCQLATMALTIKTVTIISPKCGLHARQKLSPNMGSTSLQSGLSCTRDCQTLFHPWTAVVNLASRGRNTQRQYVNKSKNVVRSCMHWSKSVMSPACCISRGHTSVSLQLGLTRHPASREKNTQRQ